MFQAIIEHFEQAVAIYGFVDVFITWVVVILAVFILVYKFIKPY